VRVIVTQKPSKTQVAATSDVGGETPVFFNICTGPGPSLHSDSGFRRIKRRMSTLRLWHKGDGISSENQSPGIYSYVAPAIAVDLPYGSLMFQEWRCAERPNWAEGVRGPPGCRQGHAIMDCPHMTLSSAGWRRLVIEECGIQRLLP